MPPKERISQWAIKRVFFLTPQVMQNDITRGACPAGQVCCVVFDEAHKALGNYSYCQVQHCNLLQSPSFGTYTGRIVQ